MAVTALRAAVFLDKDGTVIEDLPYNVDPARMRLAPGAAEGLRRLAQLGCPLVVVSNQPGVAERRFAENALADVQRRLQEMFAACGARLDRFLYCPHARSGPCGCRKPQPGLLLRAAAELQIDLGASFMIGDILNDIEAGRRAGCRTVLLDNGHETEWRPGPLREPHQRASDLAAAALAVCAAWHTTERAV